MSKEDVDEILRQFEKAKVRDHAFDGSCCYNNNEGGQGHPECRYPYNPGRENPSGQQCLKLKEEHFDLRSVLTPLVAQTPTPQEEKEIASHCRGISNGYTYLRHRYDYETGKCTKCGKELGVEAQEEQKEGVEEECTVEFAREMVKTGHLRGLIECPLHGHHNPYHMSVTGEDMESTPTVKEESHTPDDGLETRAIHTTGEALEIVNTEKRKIESHTQGWDWEKRFDEQFVPKENQGGLVGALAGPMREYAEELRAFIKEVVEVVEKQAMLRQRHYDEKLARDREASAFDAGYAQCKVDAVAVVPRAVDLFFVGHECKCGNLIICKQWNMLRELVLTALEAIKNKK